MVAGCREDFWRFSHCVVFHLIWLNEVTLKLFTSKVS